MLGALRSFQFINLLSLSNILQCRNDRYESAWLLSPVLSLQKEAAQNSPFNEWQQSFVS